MRRFLPAAVIALLLVAVATPVNAGYLIIRLVLEGAGGGGVETGAPPIGPVGPPPVITGTGGGRPPGPGGGRPSGPPGPMGFPQPMGPTQPTGPGPMGGVAEAESDPTRSLVIVVPVEEDLSKQTPFYPGQGHLLRNPLWTKLHLTHRDEKIVTNLFTDSSTVQWYSTLKETPGFRRTHASDIREAYAKWVKAKFADPKAGYALVVDALTHGMVDEAVKYADELLVSLKDKKDALPAEVAAFVKAYGAMQQGIKAAPAKRSNAERLQGTLEATNVVPSAHYVLLYWDATDDEVRRRLVMLEENFKAFYLWHATRGIELKFPEAPMVVALAKQGKELLRLARALDAPPRLPADGFYSVEHDVLVLSPERIDPLGLTFHSQMREMYQAGVSRKELLAGGGPKIDANGENGLKKPDDVARMQTMALIERMVDENAALCAISREGTLQLLYSTRQLPRFVAVPEWLSNGAVNFFTRPKDPAFVTGPDGKSWMTVAPTTGYGVPNYVLQRQFRDVYGSLLEERKDRKQAAEQSAQRVAMLKSVIADAYFLGLRDPREANDPDPVEPDKSGVALNTGGTPQNPNPGGGQPGPIGPRPMFGVGGEGQPPMGAGTIPGGGEPVPPKEDPALLLRKKRDRLAVKAQSTSWALYYYLAKDRPNELRAFAAEIAAMPRDLPLDSLTTTAAFCRAFNLDGSNQAYAKFADAWLEYIRTVPPAGIDIPLVNPKPPATGPAPGTGGEGTPPVPLPKGGAGRTGGGS